jgi:hypothetical protein
MSMRQLGKSFYMSKEKRPPVYGITGPYSKQGECTTNKGETNPSAKLIIMDDRIHHSPQTLNRVVVESGATPELDVFQTTDAI